MGVPEMGIPEMAAGEEMGDMDCCDTPVTDPPTIDQMADTLIETPDTTKLFFGEVIGSFRQLIKRTCLSEVVRVPENTETSSFVIRRRAFPEYGGRIPDGSSVFSDSMVLTYANGQKYVPAATTNLNYVARMFLAWRGSVRWTIDTSTLNVQSGTDRFNSISPYISRDSSTGRTTRNEALLTPGTPAQNINITTIDDEDFLALRGAYLGNTNVNPILSAEIPFYYNGRFLYTENDPTYVGLVNEPSYIFRAVLPGSGPDTDISLVRLFCSAGEDMNFFYFNGMPPMFYQPSLPNDPGP